MSSPPPYVSTPEKLLQILNSFTISRSAGTEGEKNMQLTLFSALKSHGLTAKVENIPYYRFSRLILHFPEFILFICFIGAILMLIFSQIIICIVLLIGGLMISWWLRRNRVIENRMKARRSPLTSKNFEISMPSHKNLEIEMKMACIILITPLDSVDFLIPPRLIGIFGKWIFYSTCGVIVLQIIRYFRLDHPDYTVLVQFSNWISLLLLIINIGCLVCLFLSDPQNSTSSAISTAIGPASLLILHDWLRDSKIKLEWCDLITIWSGADYLGLWGTQAFFQNQRSFLEEYKDIYIIRIESIQPTLRIRWKSYTKAKHAFPPALLEIIHHHLLDLPYSMHWEISQNRLFPSADWGKYSVPHGESWVFKVEDIKKPPKEPEIPGSLESSLMLNLIVLLYNVILSLDKRIQDKIDAAE